MPNYHSVISLYSRPHTVCHLICHLHHLILSYFLEERWRQTQTQHIHKWPKKEKISLLLWQSIFWYRHQNVTNFWYQSVGNNWYQLLRSNWKSKSKSVTQQVLRNPDCRWSNLFTFMLLLIYYGLNQPFDEVIMKARSPLAFISMNYFNKLW